MTALSAKEKELLSRIDPNRVPRHVAVIMDGNGRWAKKRLLPRIAGHRSGMESVRRVVDAAGDAGIAYLTLYAFSSENWVRPPDEISGLMTLLKEYLRREVDELDENNIRLRTIGRTDRFSPDVQEELAKAIGRLDQNTGPTLILALNYGGRQEITEAARSLGEGIKSGEIDPADIDEDLFARRLFTAEFPDPDLMIRTSGEMRLSNFLLWQLAYAEFHVTSKLWPDFTKADFFEALLDYQQRERRFGGVEAVK